MAYVLGQFQVPQYEDANGAPASGYKISFFLTGTSTRTPVYSDSSGTALSDGATTGTVNLNSLGQPETAGGTACNIFFDTAIVYKYQLYLSDGTTPVGPTVDPFYPNSGITDTSNVSNGDALVGVKRTGTNSVAITQHDVNEGRVVYLRDYLSSSQWTDFSGRTGAVDISTQIQNAIDDIETAGGGKLVFGVAGKALCDSGLTYNADQVSIDFCGSTVDFSNMTTGSAFAPGQSESTANLRNAYNHTRKLNNGIFLGPGVATTAVTALTVDDSASPNTLSGGKVENCAFIDFAEDVSLEDGAFCWKFVDCNFTQTSGTATTYSINIPSGTNSGERNSFRGCMFNNKALIISQANANATTYFYDCSLDGFVTGITLTAGTIHILGGHIECSDDGSTGGYYASLATGVDALLTIDGTTLIQQDDRASLGLFNVASAVSSGGLVLGDISIALGSVTIGTTTASVPLVTGTGRVVGPRSITYQDGGQHPVISDNLNTLAYPGFEDSDYTNEWTLNSGANAAVRSNTEANNGTYSLLMEATSGSTTSIAYHDFSVKPGDKVVMELWYIIPSSSATGWTFILQFDWLDAGGTVISQVFQSSISSFQASWLKSNPTINEPAPKGATHGRLTLQSTYGATASILAYVDDIIINVV